MGWSHRRAVPAGLCAAAAAEDRGRSRAAAFRTDENRDRLRAAGAGARAALNALGVTCRPDRPMGISAFLSPSDTFIDTRATDKTRLLQELSRRAAASLDLPPERIAAEILKREDLGSTGTGGGV